MVTLLKTAEELVLTSTIVYNYESEIDKGITLYKDLCMKDQYSPDERFRALLSLIERVPTEGKEMIIRLRDTLPYVDGIVLSNLIYLLTLIAKSSLVPSHERLVNIVCFYNRG